MLHMGEYIVPEIQKEPEEFGWIPSEACKYNRILGCMTSSRTIYITHMQDL